MEKSHKQIISILCIVLGIIFVAIGSVVWYWQLKPYWKVRQSVSWQAVRAVVISIKGYDDWAKPRNKHESINYFVSCFHFKPTSVAKLGRIY